MTDDRLFFRIDGIAAGYRGQAVIDGICLLSKTGGVHGDYYREET